MAADGIEAVIPQRKGAVEIYAFDPEKYKWRHPVEAAISRYKRIFGGQLRAWSLPAQKAELGVSVWVLD